MVERKYNYFYRITNKINGKIYYGIHSSDVDLSKDNYLGSGAAICRAVSKYGRENFVRDDLEFFENRHQLSLFETLWVDRTVILDKDTYNLKEGGDPEIYLGGTFAPEVCEKISRAKQGKRRSEAVRKRLSEAITGKVHGYHPESMVQIFVDQKDWPDYGVQGFVRGRPKNSENVKEKLRKAQSNRAWVHREGLELRVRKDALKEYLEKGWLLGRNSGLNVGRKGPMLGKHHSEEFKLKRSLDQKGRMCVHRESEIRYIKPEQWLEFEKAGFLKGSGRPSPKKGKKLSESTIQKLKSRKLKPVSEETRKRISEALRGKKRGPLTELHRQHLSESHKGNKRSKESVQKQLETRKRNKLKNGSGY